MCSCTLFIYSLMSGSSQVRESLNLPHSHFCAVGSALLPGDAPNRYFLFCWKPFRCLRTPACSPESISHPWQTAPVPSLQCCRILNLHPVGSLLGPSHTVRVLRWGGPICLQQPETHILLALHDPRDLISVNKNLKLFLHFDSLLKLVASTKLCF